MILLWRQRSLQTLRSFASNQIKSHCRHGLFTKPDGLKPETSEKARARLERLVSRLPKFLQAYTRPLLNAPVTHISAFLLLHELTAVIPLFVLAGTFHYTQWLPSSIGDGPLVGDGVEKFERYFRKRGWLGEEARGNFEWWGNGKGASRTVVEFATAYALTKVLLPLRLILSVWATPWFARVSIIPGTKLFRHMFWKGRKS